MKLIDATKICDNLIEKLSAHCEIINVAGSVRRKKTEVGDIEIVAVAKKTEIADLFGEISFCANPQFVHIVNSIGNRIKGSPNGRYIQIILPENINLDLFLPEKTDYYRQFAIRTGSADYSHKVIAARWVKLGWVGTSSGLRKREDCQKTKINSWEIINTECQLPPVWKSEEEFFYWLGIRYLQPENRI